jgi:hypothetical protein
MTKMGVYAGDVLNGISWCRARQIPLLNRLQAISKVLVYRIDTRKQGSLFYLRLKNFSSLCVIFFENAFEIASNNLKREVV